MTLPSTFKEYYTQIDDLTLSKTRRKMNRKSHKGRYYGGIAGDQSGMGMDGAGTGPGPGTGGGFGPGTGEGGGAFGGPGGAGGAFGSGGGNGGGGGGASAEEVDLCPHCGQSLDDEMYHDYVGDEDEEYKYWAQSEWDEESEECPMHDEYDERCPYCVTVNQDDENCPYCSDTHASSYEEEEEGSFEKWLEPAKDALTPEQLADWKDLLYNRWEAGERVQDALQDVHAQLYLDDDDYYGTEDEEDECTNCEKPGPCPHDGNCEKQDAGLCPHDAEDEEQEAEAGQGQEPSLDDMPPEYGDEMPDDELSGGEEMPDGELSGGEEMPDEMPDELGGDAEGDPNKQGMIRTVPGAHLIFKRSNTEGNFEELWIFHIGPGVRDEMDIRREVLAGTDIHPEQTRSEDGSQNVEMWAAGNALLMKITGLPN